MSRRRRGSARVHVGGEHFGLSFPLGCLPPATLLILILLGLPMLIDACNR